VGPAAGLDAEGPQGWFGIGIRATDQGALVTLVHAGTGAQTADLRKGDVIEDIGGVPLAGLDVSAMIETMAGAPETRATMTVRRRDDVLEIEVTRTQRPAPDVIERLRLDSMIDDAPVGQRVSMRLRLLRPEDGADAVVSVWRRYLDERGDQPAEESAALAVLAALEGRDGAAAALDAIVATADGDLTRQPRYQRRVADTLLELDPPRAADADARAMAGLEVAGAGHPERPWLYRVLAEAYLQLDLPAEAAAAAAGAVEAYAPPTLTWCDPSTGSLTDQVVGASASLARLHATALHAAGEDAAAREVLTRALAYRHDTETAVLLADLGGVPPLDSRPFPAFDLERIDTTGRVTDADLAGGPALVVLWASWCGPCRAELDHLRDNYQAYDDAGVTVLAINVMDQPSAARQAAADGNWPFPAVMDTEGSLTEQLGVTSIPRSFALDGDGRIVRSSKGFSSAAAGDQLALLSGLAGSTGAMAHLLQVEIGDELLHLQALVELPLARLVTPARRGEEPALAVATVDGRVGWLGDDGLDGGGLAELTITPRQLHAMPDGTLAVVGKQAVVLVRPDRGTDVLPFSEQILSSAVAGDLLLVGPGGKTLVHAVSSDAQERWVGGDADVSWALVALPEPVGDAVAGRLTPGGLDLLAAEGRVVSRIELPDRPSNAAAAGERLVLSSTLETATHGDLLGDGGDVTVVLLRTRQVLGIDAAGELLFRFLVAGDADIACADLDGDGRDELYLALPDVGVACLRVGLDTP
jgi:peroxiredoxin